MSVYQGLTVRHYDRHELDLPAELVIAPEHVEQVRFTNLNAGVINATTIKVSVRDVSRGGLGMESPLFLPRMVKATVRVALGPAGADQRFLERQIRIRRTIMSSETPTYLLGSQFISCDDDREEDLQALLQLADERGPIGGMAG